MRLPPALSTSTSSFGRSTLSHLGCVPRMWTGLTEGRSYSFRAALRRGEGAVPLRGWQVRLLPLPRRLGTGEKERTHIGTLSRSSKEEADLRDYVKTRCPTTTAAHRSARAPAAMQGAPYVWHLLAYRPSVVSRCCQKRPTRTPSRLPILRLHLTYAVYGRVADGARTASSGATIRCHRFLGVAGCCRIGLDKLFLQPSATLGDRCRRIVAPKVAGSSPVGHLPIVRICKPN